MDSKEFTELVDIFVQVRDKKRELDAAYKIAAAELDELIEEARAAMLSYMQASEGQETIRTIHGTVSKVASVKFIVRDKQAFSQYVKEQDQLGLLEVRPVKRNVMELISAGNPVPPGLEQRTEYLVRVTAA